MHKSVLKEESVRYLNLHKGDVVVDATIGCGGHASLILQKILPKGLLIGIDQDEEALEEAKKTLSIYKKNSYKLVKDNFRNIDSILERSGVKKVDGALFDLGISSLELDDSDRGFSINKDGPLDMRMDRGKGITAYDVVNRYPRQRLEEIIREYGEERFAGRIARIITEKRKQVKITRTSELVYLILKAVGYKYGHSRIHPATRTFQAIRIEVNSEIDALSEAIEKLPSILNKGARVCVISFHSLEDRIVKVGFKKYAREGRCSLINKKPITPTEEEIKENPRARSAKMRIAEFK